jgi:hypothetical protein
LLWRDQQRCRHGPDARWRYESGARNGVASPWRKLRQAFAPRPTMAATTADRLRILMSSAIPREDAAGILRWGECAGRTGIRHASAWARPDGEQDRCRVRTGQWPSAGVCLGASRRTDQMRGIDAQDFQRARVFCLQIVVENNFGIGRAIEPAIRLNFAFELPWRPSRIAKR